MDELTLLRKVVEFVGIDISTELILHEDASKIEAKLLSDAGCVAMMKALGLKGVSPKIIPPTNSYELGMWGVRLYEAGKEWEVGFYAPDLNHAILEAVKKYVGGNDA
ncbi:hypothetical protein M0R19_05475 [Candidatus Pacearchaeota archaeon]|jgi:hypothetical protein|nr:hypothetical protein [Candidatus Pacearchaeota archaeon]